MAVTGWPVLTCMRGGSPIEVVRTGFVGLCLSYAAGALFLWFIWWCSMESAAEQTQAKRTQAGDSEERFADDQRLRDMGWEILSRPEKGPVWWYHRASETRATFDEAMRLVAKHHENRPEKYKW